MASKRKLEDDVDALSPASKSAKVSDEVTRSGRVRKKPARFQDTEEEFDEDGAPTGPPPTGSAELAKTTEPSKPKSGQKLQTTVINTPEVAVIESPKVAKVVTTPKMVTTAKKVPQKPIGAEGGVPNTVPQIISQPVKVVPVARVVSPTAQQESAEHTKTGRVRKKSTKVLEMEAFEEAERTKTTKKAAGEVPQRNQKSPTVKKVGDKPASIVPAELSPTGQLPVSLFADKPPVKVEPAEQLLDTSIPPQALSAPAIQGKINPALVNLPPFPPSKLGTPASKKAKKKKDDPKLLPEALSAIPPMPPSALAMPASSKKTMKAKPRKSVEVMDVDLSNVGTSMPVKEEPLEGSGVRGQPTQVANPLVLSAVANSVRVKREPASPSKAPKKVTTAAQDETDPTLVETGIRLPQKSSPVAVAGGGSKSVIKMLLNTPTQFSKPSVSTQSINSEKSAKSASVLFQNRSPSSDSDLLIDPSFVKNESAEISGLKLKNLTVPDQLSTASHAVSDSILLGDQGHSSMDDDSFEKKKPVKKVPLRKSISIEQLDDDDDDDEDDDDDDDFDNPDDSGEWEFENQDGKLVIADFATKGLEMDEDGGQLESEEKSKSKKSRTKTKTVPRKKTAKSKSDTPDNEDGKKQGKQTKEKTKKRLTAYTMWCNTVRTKVLNENRGMDSDMESLGRREMEAIHQEKQDDMPERLPLRSSVVNQELESDPEREVQTLPNNIPHLKNTLLWEIQSPHEVTHPVDEDTKPPYLEEQSLHEQPENVTDSVEMETALSSSAVLPVVTERTESMSSNMQSSYDHTESVLHELQALPLETQILLQKVISLPKNTQMLLKKLQNLPAESNIFPVREQNLSEESAAVRPSNVETLWNEQNTIPVAIETLDSGQSEKSLCGIAENTVPDGQTLSMEIESINDDVENLEGSHCTDLESLRTPQADSGDICSGSVLSIIKNTTKRSKQLQRSCRIIEMQKSTRNQDKDFVNDLESSEGEDSMIEEAISGSNWSSESENEMSEEKHGASNHDCRSKTNDILNKERRVIQVFHNYASKTKPSGSQESSINQGESSHQSKKFAEDTKRKKKLKSRKQYEVKLKLRCIEFAKVLGNAAAGRHFNMSEKNVRLWRTMEGKLLQQNKGFHIGRVKYPRVEKGLAAFVSECKTKEIPLTMVAIVIEATRLMKSILGKVYHRESSLYRWCEAFLQRHAIDIDTRMVNNNTFQDTDGDDVHQSRCQTSKKVQAKEKMECADYAKYRGNGAADQLFDSTQQNVKRCRKLEELLRCKESNFPVMDPKVEEALLSFVSKCEKTHRPLTMVTFVEEARPLLNSLELRNNRSLYSVCRSFLQRHKIHIDMGMPDVRTGEAKSVTLNKTLVKRKSKCGKFLKKKSKKLTGLKKHINTDGKSCSVTGRYVGNSGKDGSVESNLDKRESNVQERQKSIKQIHKSKSVQMLNDEESCEEPALLMEIESIDEDLDQGVDEENELESRPSVSHDVLVSESSACKPSVCLLDHILHNKMHVQLLHGHCYDAGTSNLSVQASSKFPETLESEESDLLMTDEADLIQNSGECMTDLPESPVSSDISTKPCGSGDTNVVTQKSKRSKRIASRQKSCVWNKEEEIVSDFDSSEDEESVIEEMTSGSNWSDESESEMLRKNTEQKKRRFGLKGLKSYASSKNRESVMCSDIEAAESDDYESKEERKNLEFSKNNERFNSLGNEDNTCDEFDSDQETKGTKKPKHNYKREQKLECIEYAKLHSNRAACRRFNIPENSICRWRATEEEIRNQPNRCHKIMGVKNPEIETAMVSYVAELKGEGKPISMQGMKAKAINLFKEVQGKEFDDSWIRKWVKQFLKCRRIKLDIKRGSYKSVKNDKNDEQTVNEGVKVKRSRQSYNMTYKLECIEYAKKHGNIATGKRYNMSEKNVREWRKFESILRNRKNKDGKKFPEAKSPQVETAVMSYVSECEGKNEALTMTALAEVVRRTFRSVVGKEFKRNTHLYAWCKRFLQRHGIKIDTSIPRKAAVVPGKKRQKYTVQLKLECLEHARKYGNRSAMTKFNVGEKFIRDCKKVEKTLRSVPNPNTCTRYRGSRDNTKYPELRTAMASYVLECQNLKRHIRLQEVHDEALRLFKVIYGKDPEEEGFKGSNNWCSKLVRSIWKQNNIPSTRKKRTVNKVKRGDP